MHKMVYSFKVESVLLSNSDCKCKFMRNFLPYRSSTSAFYLWTFPLPRFVRYCKIGDCHLSKGNHANLQRLGRSSLKFKAGFSDGTMTRIIKVERARDSLPFLSLFLPHAYFRRRFLFLFPLRTYLCLPDPVASNGSDTIPSVIKQLENTFHSLSTSGGLRYASNHFEHSTDLNRFEYFPKEEKLLIERGTTDSSTLSKNSSTFRNPRDSTRLVKCKVIQIAITTPNGMKLAVSTVVPPGGREGITPIAIVQSLLFIMGSRRWLNSCISPLFYT